LTNFAAQQLRELPYFFVLTV